MYQSLTSVRRAINRPVTKRLIDLHEKGFVYDFYVKDACSITCAQDGLNFLKHETLIELIDLGYDQLSNAYTYVHSVDTFCGYKGIMMSAEILCTNRFWLT